MTHLCCRYRTITCILALVGMAIGAQVARAQALIGTIPDGVGMSPPVTVSVGFTSTSRFIRLHSVHAWGPWGPYIDGYDYLTSECAGVEFNVTAQCLVNGAEIPPSSHMADVNVFGECVEVYSWQDVVIDLGSPGAFSIELRLGNSVGTGLVTYRGWEIYEAEAPVSLESVNWSGVKAMFAD